MVDCYGILDLRSEQYIQPLTPSLLSSLSLLHTTIPPQIRISQLRSTLQPPAMMDKLPQDVDVVPCEQSKTKTGTLQDELEEIEEVKTLAR